MSKHTPGPWIVDDRFATCVRSPSGTVVANTDNADGVSNARLIAAAPELLEALRAIVIESGGKAIPNESLTACRNRALAAIAKAEGRADA